MSFEGFTCWKREDALGLLSTEALEGDDGLFLATHSPVSEFSVAGSNSTLVKANTEAALLEALAQRETRHMFCVIEGEPGSGKSHLIRWLKVNWPKAEDDLVLLIQRADGSLEGTLRQLQGRLPPKYREIFDGIGPTRNVADEGKKQDFLTKIANSMSKAYFSDPPADAEWCEQHQLAHVLRHPKVFELWSAPKRVLQVIGGRGSKGGKRDQELARFSLKDVVDLGQMDRSLRGLPLAAKRWTKSLRKESEELQKLVSAHADDQLREQYRENFPNSFALLDALEHRLNNAIQELLGTTARQLDELFLRLRKQLHSEGRRLVLLLEDITNFQGVDEKLIDALVLNASTTIDNEICDIISVLGVTPDYFTQYIQKKSNYFQRITLHIELQPVKREEEGWEREASEFAVSFAARYLRAIRAGRESLKSYDGASPVYNRCQDCQYQSECHQFFGAVDNVGLYPLSPQAIGSLYTSLEDPSGSMTAQTPRGLIQNVLNPTLQRPEVIEDQGYPGPEIETSFVQRPAMPGRVRNVIEREGGGDAERLGRVVSWWGRPSGESSGVDRRGNPTFQDVPKGVLEAFGLPWLGKADVSNAPAPPPESAAESREVEAESREDENSSEPEVAPREQRSKAKRRRSTSKATFWQLSDSKLESRMRQLDEWLKGSGKLEDGEAFWNRCVFEFLHKEVSWRRLGISPWLQWTLFTKARVMISGTKREHNQFVLPKEEWVRSGLEAFLTLEAKSGAASQSDYYRYRLAQFVRKLEGLVLRFVDASLRPSGNLPWSPVGLVIQVALVRAWLRGTLDPLAPLSEQWKYLFHGEPSAKSSPARRVASWNEMVLRTRALPVELAKRLPHMLDQPQGRTDSKLDGHLPRGMADPSDAIDAIRALRDSFSFSSHPAESDIKVDPFLRNVLKIAGDMASCGQVPRREGQRLLKAASKLDEACNGASAQDFAARVDKAVRGLQELGAGAPMAPIQKWSEHYTGLVRTGFLSADSGGRLDALDEFKADARGRDLEDFSSPAELLQWCLRAPVDELDASTEMVERAESSLETLWSFAESLLADPAVADESDGSLKDVNDAGAQVGAICGELRDGIEGAQ